MRSPLIDRFVLSSLFLIFFDAVSCHSPGDSKNVITFWAMGAEGERVLMMLPEFERRNPGIRVKLQMIPWTAAHEKLLTAYAGSSTPDMCQLGNTWIPEFSILGALEDLRPWTQRSLRIGPEHYFPGFWETNVVDGVLFGIPWYADTRVLFYRKDILARAGYPEGPKSWDDLMDASMKIKAQNPGQDHYAIFLPTNEWNVPVILGMQAGSTLLKDGNRYGDFSGAEYQRAFAFYMSFFKKKLTPGGLSQMTNVVLGFGEGYFAMYVTGPWNIGEFTRRLPKGVQHEWMTAPMPSPGKTFPGISLAGGSSLAMFKSSAQKGQVWKLIEYLSEPEQQIRFYRLTGDLPARKESWEDTSFARNQYVKAFHKQLSDVLPTPRIPEWEQIALKLQEYLEAASMGKMTEAEALAALDVDVNRILEKRRWMLSRQ